MSIFYWGKQIAPEGGGIRWRSKNFDQWIKSDEWRGIQNHKDVYLMTDFSICQVDWFKLNKQIYKPTKIIRFERLQKDWFKIAKKNRSYIRTSSTTFNKEI